MKRIAVLPLFERSLKELNKPDRERVSEAIEQFGSFVYSGVIVAGLGFKKLAEDIYEFRAGLKLRILVYEESNIYYLVLAGNHEQIKRYLRK